MLRPLTRLRPVPRADAPPGQRPFIPSRPGGPNPEPFRPTSAPVGLTSCIFLMRHQYAPRRLPMDVAPGSCACSPDSIRVLTPTGRRRRTRPGRAWPGAKSPGVEEGLGGGAWTGVAGGGRHSDVTCLEPSLLRYRRENRSPGSVTCGLLWLVLSGVRGQTLCRRCLEVLRSNPAPKVACFHLRDERLQN